jgi:hypothetical protein
MVEGKCLCHQAMKITVLLQKKDKWKKRFNVPLDISLKTILIEIISFLFKIKMTGYQ